MMSTELFEINVAFCVDQNFLMQTAVAARSAVESTSAFIRFHVVTTGVDQYHWDLFQRSLPDRCAVRHWPISLDFATSLSIVDNIPVISYAWLLLTSILPPELNRILYLDADILIQGDIADLFATELDEFLFAAVQDQCEYVIGRAMPNWKALGLPPEAPYCNNGVLLFDLQHWRASNVSEAVLEFARLHSGNLHYADQCALNAIVHSRWKLLAPRCNVQTALRGKDDWRMAFRQPDEVDEALRNPLITHYTGTRKPWSSSEAAAAHSSWYDVLDRTSWAGWRPQVLNLPLVESVKNRAKQILDVGRHG